MALIGLAVAVAAAFVVCWLVRKCGESRQAAERSALCAKFGIRTDGRSHFVMVPAVLPHNAGAAKLGAELFIDRRLAQTSRRTCASCHWLNMGGSDGQLHSGRLTYPFVNSIFSSVFLHDGSKTNFGEVVKLMIESKDFAGGGPMEKVVGKLAFDKALASRFKLCYGDAPNASNVVDAVQQYARTQITSGRALDRFCDGNAAALTPLQQIGKDAFISAGCIGCHDGPALGGRKVYQGHKVPALRGLPVRHVYRFDGAKTDLRAVVAMMPCEFMDDDVRSALLDFLKSL